MILYCPVMNTSVAELFMAGVMPGLPIGGVFIGYTMWTARKKSWAASERAGIKEILPPCARVPGV
jgi:C4-dicarboxylate transporter DctM subunit